MSASSIVSSFGSFSSGMVAFRDLVDKPIEWSKCIKDKSIDLSKKGSKKLNTDSKLTDWVKKKLGK